MDASYAFHVGCRVPTGAIMTFGSGAVTGFSQKQKLNAKSSTEAELIGVDDASNTLDTLFFGTPRISNLFQHAISGQ